MLVLAIGNALNRKGLSFGKARELGVDASYRVGENRLGFASYNCTYSLKDIFVGNANVEERELYQIVYIIAGGEGALYIDIIATQPGELAVLSNVVKDVDLG